MRFVAMGGSLRQDSLNRRLIGFLVSQVEAQGHQVTSFSGEALRMPLLDADAEVPEGVELSEANGLILVSPEYNASVPPHLKNALDWVSIQRPSPLRGLPVLLASASPGAFGGARGLLAWRLILANVGALVLPGALSVPLADRSLDDQGAPTDSRSLQEARRVLEAFLKMVAQLSVR